MRNNLYQLLLEIPSLKDEKVFVKTEWLRRLWQDLYCEEYKTENIDNFLFNAMLYHNLISYCLDLFSLRNLRKIGPKNSLEKLIEIKKLCEIIKERFKYDINLDLTPEDLLGAKINDNI